MPRARVLDVQARTHADRFDSMERAATAAEAAALVAAEPAAAAAAGAAPPPPSVLLFPEHRQYPLKLTCALPQRWAARGRAGGAMRSSVRPGEFFVWQIGVYAPSRDVRILNASLPLARWRAAEQAARLAPPPDGALAAALSLHSFSTGGVGHRGQRVTFTPRTAAAARARCGLGSTSPRPRPPAPNESTPRSTCSSSLQARRRAASPSRSG